MRNKAGFMILTLLLLTVPVLANAWNLTVKVAGGDTSNYATVAYGTSTQKMQSGTFYLYPQVAVALTNTGATPTYTLDGNVATVANIQALASGSHLVTVTYSSAITTFGLSLTQPAAGGAIYAQNRNTTWTTAGVTGLTSRALVPVTFAPDANHKITFYNATSATLVPYAGAKGVAYSLSVPAKNQNVGVVFAVVNNVTATLWAPTSVAAGKGTATVTGSANDGGTLTYALTANAVSVPVVSGNVFNLAGLAAGTYTLVGTVTSTAGAIVTSTNTDPFTVTVVDATVSANTGCVSCHTTSTPNVVINLPLGVHANTTCVACHTADAPHATNPISCSTAACHTTSPKGHPAFDASTQKCDTCHTADVLNGTTDAHGASRIEKCTECHLTIRNAGADYVQDNNGVRAIIPEFQKTSHHIYNGPTALPIDAQCAVCHLEGKASGTAVIVDPAYHMVDAKIHLRNADTDADFAWDPSAVTPNHTLMDNFCFSCHDSNGATSTGVIAIQTVIKAANPAALTPAAITALGTATVAAGNPFIDLLTNKYDQVTRARVIDALTAFTGTNASHHAVKAPKYTTRTTTTAMAALGQKTLFDGGLFVSDYTPLGAALPVADDSSLHCGDCHTVGQWKNDNTKYNQAAIGAHGSVNEYMLRNNAGTDALHNGTTYVCFNCHNDKAGVNTAGGYYAGYTVAGGSPTTGHINGIHAGTNGCLQNTAGNTGNAIAATGRLGGNMFGGVSKGGSQGNITGIACTNCHNSGDRGKLGATAFNGYTTVNTGLGGIHGGNASYSDSNGAKQKPYRFMSGMGNFKYIPPANTFTTVTATGQPSTVKGAAMPDTTSLGSCYTNSATTDNAGYSSCNHHAAGTTIQRVGGTASNVTRPLSY